MLSFTDGLLTWWLRIVFSSPNDVYGMWQL
jgi:hypothetical protein